MFRKIVAFIVILIVLFTVSSSVLAAQRLGTGRISGGAYGILYYIDSSASSYCESIGYGFARWKNIDSSITINRTYTKSYSRCDNYWGYFWPSTSTIAAETEFFVNNLPITSWDNDWYWVKVRYNAYLYVIGDPIYDYARRKAVACHEYGHFLGLDHTGDVENDIMFPYALFMEAEYPCDAEKAMVSLIY